MSTRYVVHVQEYAQRHYLKQFAKKYKDSFDAPWRAFLLMLGSFDLMLEKKRTVPISDPYAPIVICKCEFKVLPHESAKSAGNRCIIAQDKECKEVQVLLMYHKSDIGGHNETQWWKGLVKDNYPEYTHLL